VSEATSPEQPRPGVTRLAVRSEHVDKPSQERIDEFLGTLRRVLEECERWHYMDVDGEDGRSFTCSLTVIWKRPQPDALQPDPPVT
jgi:hypothetical protein